MRPLVALSLLLFAAPAFADTFVYVSLASEKKIAIYKMGPKHGKLTLVAHAPLDGEPGALTTDPAKRFLFAALRAEGKLTALRIDGATGKLTPINTVPAGADPAQISTDRTGKFLLAAYYVAGKVTVHAIAKDGSLSKAPVQSLSTADKAHAIVPDRTNRWVFVPHTGPNVTFQFAFDAKTGKLTPNAVPTLKAPPKTGPRHLVFHPSKEIAYVVNEQGGSVTTYALDVKAGTLKPVQTISTLPPRYKGTNACAEVRLDPTGRLLYASNRGHDSIACFAIEKDGLLRALDRVPTEKNPRSFDLSPDGGFLYAAGESSGKLAAYRIDGTTGMLTRIATYEVGKQPWWVMAVRLGAK